MYQQRNTTVQGDVRFVTAEHLSPHCSLSSIDSTGSGPTFRPPPPPAALGDTFTEGPNETAVQSTPKSPRRNKRRSFIPTPSRQVLLYALHIIIRLNC